MSNLITLGDVIQKITQDHGEKSLLDAQFILAVFMDLAPNLKKEKELLRAFLLCNGAKKIIDTKSEPYEVQEACFASIVRDLEENQWLSEDAAKYVCAEFYKGLTNHEWVFYTNEKKVSYDLDVYKTVTITNPVRNAPISVSVEVDGKAISVLLPDHVTNGQTVCFPRKGKQDQATGQTGDLYVTIYLHANQTSKGIIAVVAVVMLLFVIVAALANAGKNESGSTITTASIQPSPDANNTVTSKNSHSHSWNQATYNDPQICKTCGVTEGAKKTPSSELNLRNIISNADASSVYAGDNLGKHTPEKMYDGKLDTNWTENALGNGIGEYVTFYFDDTYAIKKMHIYIGSHYSESVYEQNCRPKVITVTFSDGSTERIQLKDSYDKQIIVFSRYYYTDYIKLTIEEVYQGTKHLDAVIAELDFVAYRP